MGSNQKLTAEAPLDPDLWDPDSPGYRKEFFNVYGYFPLPDDAPAEYRGRFRLSSGDLRAIADAMDFASNHGIGTFWLAAFGNLKIGFDEDCQQHFFRVR